MLRACDGLDNNCDGVTDSDDAADAPMWYIDLDHDGFGVALETRGHALSHRAMSTAATAMTMTAP